MTSRNARKAEVSEKVKEIKRMQQNWMKQRADAKEDGGTDQTESSQRKAEAKSGPGKTQPTQKHNVTTFTCGKPGYKGQVTRTEQPGNKGPVNKTQQPVAQIAVSNYKPTRTTGSQKAQPGQKNVVPKHNVEKHSNGAGSQKNVTQKQSLYHDNKDFKEKFRHWLNVKNEPIDNGSALKVSDGTKSDDYLPDGTVSKTAPVMSEHSIENLADNIVSRVKNQLYTGPGEKESVSYHQPESTAWMKRSPDVGRVVDTPLTEGSSTWRSSGDGRSLVDDELYDSHTCPVCGNIMVQPHIPMLLVPCGHTGCQPCLAPRVLCPMCGADIKSQTCNIMLHQIIMTHQEESKTRQVYSPKNYESEANYEEEYTSLSIRCEALTEELAASNRSLVEVSDELSQGKAQCDSIEQEERRMQNEINQLQESLGQLKKHREEYEVNCRNLERKASEERDRVKMLEETLRGLNRDREKAKILCGRNES